MHVEHSGPQPHWFTCDFCDRKVPLHKFQLEPDDQREFISEHTTSLHICDECLNRLRDAIKKIEDKRVTPVYRGQ